MKNFKLFVLAVLSIGLFTIASCGDDEAPTPSGPSFTITDLTLAAAGRANDGEVVGKIKLVNNTNAPINLMWERSNEQIPTDWTTAICDHLLCYSPTVASKELSLTANQEIEFKLNFYPAGNIGNGSVDLTIYETSDKVGTSVTKSFTCTVQ